MDLPVRTVCLPTAIVAIGLRPAVRPALLAYDHCSSPCEQAEVGTGQTSGCTLGQWDKVKA